MMCVPGNESIHFSSFNNKFTHNPDARQRTLLCVLLSSWVWCGSDKPHHPTAIYTTNYWVFTYFISIHLSMHFSYLLHCAGNFLTSPNHSSDIISRVVPQTHPAVSTMTIIYSIWVFEDTAILFQWCLQMRQLLFAQQWSRSRLKLVNSLDWNHIYTLLDNNVAISVKLLFYLMADTIFVYFVEEAFLHWQMTLAWRGGARRNTCAWRHNCMRITLIKTLEKGKETVSRRRQYEWGKLVTNRPVGTEKTLPFAASTSQAPRG